MVIGLTDWKNIKEICENGSFYAFCILSYLSYRWFLKSGATLENLISYKDNVWLGVQVFSSSFTLSLTDQCLPLPSRVKQKQLHL